MLLNPKCLVFESCVFPRAGSTQAGRAGGWLERKGALAAHAGAGMGFLLPGCAFVGIPCQMLQVWVVLQADTQCLHITWGGFTLSLPVPLPLAVASEVHLVLASPVATEPSRAWEWLLSPALPVRQGFLCPEGFIMQKFNCFVCVGQ